MSSAKSRSGTISRPAGRPAGSPPNDDPSTITRNLPAPSVESWRFPHPFVVRCGKRHDSTKVPVRVGPWSGRRAGELFEDEFSRAGGVGLAPAGLHDGADEGSRGGDLAGTDLVGGVGIVGDHLVDD